MAVNIVNNKSPNKCLLIENRIVGTNYKIKTDCYDTKNLDRFFVVKIGDRIQNANAENIKPESEIGVASYLYDDEVPYYVYKLNDVVMIASGTIQDGVLNFSNPKKVSIDNDILDKFLSEISNVDYWKMNSSLFSVSI